MRPRIFALFNFHLLLTLAVGDYSVDSHPEFPPITDALEFLELSEVAYPMRSCRYKGIPANVTCEKYIQKIDGSQMMIASSKSSKYIAVAFSGTHNARQWWKDVIIRLVPFGPEDDPISDVLVHEGFNEVVFAKNMFDEIHDTVAKLLKKHPDYRLVITGHSLGAAASVLSGTAFANLMPERKITVINYGCPKVGDENWKIYSNDFPNLDVWRFVNGKDLVPRLPFERFYHVGHTLQLDKNEALAYYLHDGDKDMGYAGVPSNWKAESFVTPMRSFEAHHTNHYKDYYFEKSVKNPDDYYFQSFVEIKNSSKHEEEKYGADNVLTFD